MTFLDGGHMGGLIALFGGLVTTLAIAACSGATSAGPTCREYMKMSVGDQNNAIVEWASDHDERVDPDNPDAGASGFAMFQIHVSMQRYCSDSAHGDDHLGDLRVSG